MNDLDLCLEVVSRSRQSLRYIRRWICLKPLELEGWFQRTTHRKWHMDYQMVTWPMTSRDFERSNSWPQYALSTISRKLLELETSNLVCSFVSRMPSTNNFPWKWAWPRSRDPCKPVRSAILATAWLLVFHDVRRAYVSYIVVVA